MAKKVILETHVLYDIGMKQVSIEDIRQPGERLFYLPISVLELVSKLDERSFEDRKAAANAILEHGKEELPDPEIASDDGIWLQIGRACPLFCRRCSRLGESRESRGGSKLRTGQCIACDDMAREGRAKMGG